MGVVPPAPGLHRGAAPGDPRARRPAGLRRGDDRLPLLARGWYGLEGPYAAGAPDLFTFGKVMGGGFPAAAFGGRADIMAMLSPAGPVYQAGTLSGNPVATAAGLATLRGCTDEVYERIGVVARTIADGASAALAAEGVAHRVQWAGLDVQRLLPRGRGHRLRRGQGPVRPTPSAASSTRCSRRASTCRRAPTSRGSSAPPTTTTAVEHVLAAAAGARRARPRRPGWRRDVGRRAHRRPPRCATVRSTTPRACSTAGSRDTTSASSGADGAARRRPPRRPTTSRASWPPRWSGPRRPPPPSPRRTSCPSSPTTG